VTYIKHTKAAAGLALGAMVALAALASPASARWNGNGQWQQDNRQWENHYNGYSYQPPPVVYSTPYNYGYQPPPVYYNGNSTPGLSIRIF
jgi:hypothetical protein